MFDASRDLQASGLLSCFYAWAAVNLRPGTVTEYRRHLERFAQAVAGVPVRELKKLHLSAWSSKFHPLQAVKRLFAWAVDEAELLQVSPFVNVKLPPLGQRRRVLTRAEAAQVLRTSTRAFRDYLLALRESIARPQEIRVVTWEDIHPRLDRSRLAALLPSGQCRFVLNEYKSRERRHDPSEQRIIVINRRLGRLLARLLRRGPDLRAPIFPNGRKAPWTKNSIRLRMRWLRKKCGLLPDHRGELVCAYTMRHTSATEAIALGMPLKLASELMGHTNVRTTNRYLHPSLDHLIKAMIDLSSAQMQRSRQSGSGFSC